MKALIKPQYVDQIPKAVKGTVGQLLDKKDEMKNQPEICKMLGKFKSNFHFRAIEISVRSVMSKNSIWTNTHVCLLSNFSLKQC